MDFGNPPVHCLSGEKRTLNEPSVWGRGKKGPAATAFATKPGSAWKPLQVIGRWVELGLHVDGLQ